MADEIQRYGWNNLGGVFVPFAADNPETEARGVYVLYADHVAALEAEREKVRQLTEAIYKAADLLGAQSDEHDARSEELAGLERELRALAAIEGESG